MPNKLKKPPSKRKPVVINPPGLDQLLIDEAEQFMERRGKQIPEPLRRRLPFLATLVRDPKLLLIRHGLVMLQDRSAFAKAYARNPEMFLELMLHLTRFHARLTPIRRALRDHWVITIRDRGRLITKPINEATAHELVAFIRTRYNKTVDTKAVSRDKERLAKLDAKRPFDTVTENALRTFAEIISRETSDDPGPPPIRMISRSKMIKEK